MTDIITTLPCPPWCVLEPGHGFAAMTDDGLLVRWHEGPERSIGAASLGLLAEETARGDSGPLVTADAPSVHLSVDDVISVPRFTGVELRQLAAGPARRRGRAGRPWRHDRRPARGLPGPACGGICSP